MSKEMVHSLSLEGLNTKEKIINYLNKTSGIKGIIVDIEVF